MEVSGELHVTFDANDTLFLNALQTNQSSEMCLTQDRYQWWAFVNVVMNLWVP